MYERTTADTDDKVGILKSIYNPNVIFLISDFSKAVLLTWFTVVACLGASFSTFSPSVYNI